MRVAIVGSFDHYFHMGNWVADAWEANGHEVIRQDRRIANEHRHFDLVIYVDCSEDYSGGILTTSDTITSKGIKKHGPVRVFWSMDAHMPGGIERSVNIARKCDIVFSSNYEHGVKILEKFGIKSHLLPITYSNRLSDTRPLDYINRIYDTCMIGHPNSSERHQLWGVLSKYKSFTGIANTAEDYIHTMTTSKVVVNQPTEPWDVILNNRLFEGMAVSALVLQKRLKTNLIEKLGFEDGIHFIYWDDFGDLDKKIKKHLKNDKERQKIASNGYRAVQKYSLNNQVAKMESIILSEFYDRL